MGIEVRPRSSQPNYMRIVRVSQGFPCCCNQTKPVYINVFRWYMPPAVLIGGTLESGSLLQK